MYGGFHQWRYPKIDGSSWKILSKWTTRGYPHLRNLHMCTDVLIMDIIPQLPPVEDGIYERIHQMDFDLWEIPSGVIKHGWKIPELNDKMKVSS